MMIALPRFFGWSLPGPVSRVFNCGQLIDLLGTMPSDTRGDLVDAAYLRLTELAARLPAADRARIMAQPGQRLRSPRLMATLCAMEPQVATAAIRAADLTQEQWLDLIPALPLAARGFLQDKADLPPAALALLARLGVAQRTLPDAPAASEGELLLSDPVPEPPAARAPLGKKPIAPAPPPPPGDDSIGAIVRRIEAFRRARHASPPNDAPQLPLDGDVTPAAPIRVFDFTSDAEGRVVWAEGGVAPMVSGHLLAGEPALALAIRQHQPFHALSLTLDGAETIAGQWQVDGVPRFDPLSGRFVGHIGRMRRPAAADATETPDGEGDRLRQVLHELRTPVNAIQGFAEIIQQQLFGPTPHEYRALAASIAADSARMLAGFEELERFARLDGGAMELASGHCDLAECVTATLARLAPQAHARGITLALDGLDHAPVTLPVIEAERLIWRLLATLSTHAVTGEQLTATLARQDGPVTSHVTLDLPLPAALAVLDDAALFHCGTGGDGTGPWAGMFGTGFALRLAGAEARCAGGSMERRGGRLYITLPGLTPISVEPSHDIPGDKGQAAPPAA